MACPLCLASIAYLQLSLLRRHKLKRALAMQMGAEYSDVKNTQVRRITAERLLQSKTTIPHYYLTVDLNADKLLELRGQLNEKLAASGGKLSVNDFIVKASALVRIRSDKSPHVALPATSRVLFKCLQLATVYEHEGPGSLQHHL